MCYAQTIILYVRKLRSRNKQKTQSPRVISGRIRQDLISTDPQSRRLSSCLRVNSDCCGAEEEHPGHCGQEWVVQEPNSIADEE